MDASAKRRRVVARLRLHDRATRDASDRGECLHARAVGVLGAWRVKREAVAFAHALEWTGLAVIQFHEAAGDRRVGVGFRYDADPIIACAHADLLLIK